MLMASHFISPPLIQVGTFPFPLFSFVKVFIRKALFLSAERWLPRSLGSFYLKDAAFIEAIEIHPDAENYADRFTIYFTTFNPSEFISVSVFFIF